MINALNPTERCWLCDGVQITGLYATRRRPLHHCFNCGNLSAVKGIEDTVLVSEKIGTVHTTRTLTSVKHKVEWSLSDDD